jgi:hypothetical protein
MRPGETWRDRPQAVIAARTCQRGCLTGTPSAEASASERGFFRGAPCRHRLPKRLPSAKRRLTR